MAYMVGEVIPLKIIPKKQPKIKTLVVFLALLGLQLFPVHV